MKLRSATRGGGIPDLAPAEPAVNVSSCLYVSPIGEPLGQGRGSERAASIVRGCGCRATPEGPTPNLRAVADALNAYPWTRGRLIVWAADVPAYCALGAMLRAAGVVPTEIARADRTPGQPFWEGWGALLEKKYGLPNLYSAHRIVTLNDAARSRAEAAGLILTRLATTCPMEELLSPRQLGRFSTHMVELQIEGILLYNGHELDHPLSPLRPSRRDWHPRGFSSPAWRPKPWRPKPKPWRPKV